MIKVIEIIKSIPYRMKNFYYLKKYGKFKVPFIKFSNKCFYKQEIHEKNDKTDKNYERIYKDNAYWVISKFANYGLYFPYQHKGLKKFKVEEGYNSRGTLL